MARPKTAAAEYTAITWRIPPDVLGALREAAQREERPVNSQLILYLRQALAARLPAPARPVAPAREA